MRHTDWKRFCCLQKRWVRRLEKFERAATAVFSLNIEALQLHNHLFRNQSINQSINQTQKQSKIYSYILKLEQRLWQMLFAPNNLLICYFWYRAEVNIDVLQFITLLVLLRIYIKMSIDSSTIDWSLKLCNVVCGMYKNNSNTSVWFSAANCELSVSAARPRDEGALSSSNAHSKEEVVQDKAWV